MGGFWVKGQHRRPLVARSWLWPLFTERDAGGGAAAVKLGKPTGFSTWSAPFLTQKVKLSWERCGTWGTYTSLEAQPSKHAPCHSGVAPVPKRKQGYSGHNYAVVDFDLVSVCLDTCSHACWPGQWQGQGQASSLQFNAATPEDVCP